MSIKHGNIEIYMGPQELGAPDDLEDVIINFIDGTESTLEVAVQELDSKIITEALIRAGSFNYTGPATRLNDENIIIIWDLAEIRINSKKAQNKLAQYAVEEI